MRSRVLALWIALLAVVHLPGCAHKPPADTLVMIIESSPANLDPRIGTDAQSERISKLIFDSLVRRDEHFQLQPALAERWEIPDALTYVFHLRSGVRFHDGRTLTARDVKWTFDSITNGSIITPKASTFRLVQSVETPDEQTIIFRLKEPNASLLWNVSDGAVGIVPYGAGANLHQQPIGSGPFRFISAAQDSDVILARNDDYWGERASISKVRLMVVPDSTTRALELRKGSADVAVNAVGADVVVALQHEPALAVMVTPGTIYAYVAFNLRDPLLRDARVRQAVAHALDRETIITYLWRDLARPAKGMLPTQHWAYTDDVPHYPHDPMRAEHILDQAGYPRGTDGVRFRLTMKTSTEETSRLMAAVFQQQLRKVGIALDIRSFEFATFYSDVIKGAFQMYSLRWIGGNEDPDIFEHVFHSASFPPKRANRSYYVNPKVDRLIDQGRRELDLAKRKQIYAELQRIMAEDLPYVSLWYMDNVIVHNRRVQNIEASASGNYDFLRRVRLAP